MNEPIPLDKKNEPVADRSKKGMNQFSSLRIAMTWLHTWCGLWASWILFAIFFTGTLGVFDAAITRWMKPEQQLLTMQLNSAEERQKVLGFAQDFLQKMHQIAISGA